MMVMEGKVEDSISTLASVASVRCLTCCGVDVEKLEAWFTDENSGAQRPCVNCPKAVGGTERFQTLICMTSKPMSVTTMLL